MRALAAAAIALLLAACGVDVEGAPCATSENCPAGQGCGADLRCSTKALGCAACRPGERRCADGALSTCVPASDGVCASWSAAACGEAQACQDTAAGAACVCVGEPEACQGVEGSACDASGALVSCARDAQGCLHVVEQLACADHERCGGAAPAAACACDPAPAVCASAVHGMFCSDARTVTDCEVTSGGCTFLVETNVCGTHQECTGGPPAASCACIPAPAGCDTSTAFCSSSKTVQTCDVDVDGCKFATATGCGLHESCTASGNGAACACDPKPAACPSNGSGTFCADLTHLQSCEVDAQRCTFGSVPVACGPHQQCGGTPGTAACACLAAPPACDSSSAFCSDARTLQTCAVDGNSCKFTTASTCGNHQTCTASGNGASCTCDLKPAACPANGSGTFCADSTHVQSCGVDAQNCTFGLTPVACAPHQQCTGSAGTASCACVPAPAACDTSSAFCSDAKTLQTCATDGNSCKFAAASTCGDHQTCTASGSAASCTCDPKPAACPANGSGTFCADASHVQSCGVDAQSCTFGPAPVACGPHQQCGGTAGSAACACVAESRCTATGATCSADRTQVLACSKDTEQCLFVDAASTVTCQDGQVCGDASPTCVPKYSITIGPPAANATVPPAGIDVTATLTLASADPVVVPVPGSLPLLVDGVEVAKLAKTPGQSGRVITYTLHYKPPANTEALVVLSTTAGSGAALASASVPVQIDTRAPVLSSLSLACDSAPCLRDGVLTVSVVAVDALLDAVTVTLDLDSNSKTVTLSNGGSGSTTYSAPLALKDWPFPAFRKDVKATITARDLAGNVTTPGAIGPVNVTRLRWASPVAASPPQLTGAAVGLDGAIIVAGNDRKLYQLDPVTGASSAAPIAIGLGFTQPPVVGVSATWLATDDGQIVAERANASITVCPASATANSMFAAVLTDATSDSPYAGGGFGLIFAPLATPQCNTTSVLPDAITSSMAAWNGYVMAPTTGATATVRRFKVGVFGTLTPDAWVPSLHDAGGGVPCASIDTAPSIDGNGRAIVACSNRQLHVIDFDAQSDTFMALPKPATESAIVLRGGDLVVGTDDNVVRRVALGPSGASSVWTFNVGAPVNGAVAVAGGVGVAVLVVTRSGTLHALTDAGVEAWSARGGDALGTSALRFPVVVSAPNGSVLPTAYVPSANGTVYAVVVDTPLDTSSPWPKPHHDLRNSGNASFPLP